jgi:patatin-related protein
LREKELRLAVVCFGGVSLAIYMHGICTEIFKLVRASSVLHGITDRRARSRATYAASHQQRNTASDSAAVYFDLLREVGRFVELRVIVDIVSGASAGGINGIMLARALAHDLRHENLTPLWLDQADINVLLAPDARAGPWSKLALKPMLWAANSAGILPALQDRDAQRNLSLLLRSRWFRPPFDGHGMTALMLDGVEAMGSSRAGASLLTSGQSLDLFVAVTDFHGRPELAQLHDPPVVQEREHRHVLHFTHSKTRGGAGSLDFDISNAPALAFAARATSSFPGAFPPAQIKEIDDVIAARGGAWPQRNDFIEKCFRSYLAHGIDPTTSVFIDGSVLNNRPFKEAIAAIHGKPAYRQVDRRLVFIDPRPDALTGATSHEVPNFVQTLRASVSDLPRAQPVIDQLNDVVDHNMRVTGLKAIIEGARPRISKLVDDVLGATFDDPLTQVELTAAREAINARVRAEAGFAYDSYVRLKSMTARATLSRLIANLRQVEERSLLGRTIAMIVDNWIISIGADYPTNGGAADCDQSANRAWTKFLRAFDVDYRKRRVSFLIERLNQIYLIIETSEQRNPNLQSINWLKGELYAALARLSDDVMLSRIGGQTLSKVFALFSHQPSFLEATDLRANAQRFAENHSQLVSDLIDRLANDLDLESTSQDLDRLLATVDRTLWAPDAIRDLVIHYLGFPYWDILTLPAIAHRPLGEFEEIRIDRISPQDARCLPCIAGADKLRGAALGSFAGFFSRSFRENDYLLGRLHGAERLIDIICDAAGLHSNAISSEIQQIKRKVFSAILQSEQSRLNRCGELVANVRSAILAI